MNKKVMALAVAGALAAPAAALAQVEIGGSLHLQYFNNDSGATASKKTDVLTTSEPEVYIRGEDKLGGGMSAWFQCTSSFDFLGTGVEGTNTAGQLCGRNSGLGFKGSFGNIFFGTWDTPQKLVVNLARGWWGGTNTLQGGSLVLLGNGAQSNAGNTGASFYRRQARSVNYHGPNWGGFTVQAAFSGANEATALSTGSPLKPRLLSIAGQFRTGPFFAGVGFEKHDDFNPGNLAAGYNGGSDDNFNVVVGYTIAGARISALYMDNSYEIGNAAAQTLDKKGWAVYLDWTISGPHSLYAQYSSVDNTSGNSTVSVGRFSPAGATATGADHYGIAYGYKFSKRTQGYLAYNQMKNDAGSNFTFGTSAGSLGGKQKVIGAGLRHSF